MIDITFLHVHYRDLKDKHKVVKIKPTDATNTLRLKQDVAEVVSKIKTKAKYYYVVIEIDRDGKPAYRTIVPKTLLNA